MFGPSIIGDVTPVIIVSTWILSSYSGRTRAPNMTFACGSSSYVSDSATSCASFSDMSGPPVMCMRHPVAPPYSTSSSGWLSAWRTTSLALSCPFASPTSMAATPPPFIMVRTSA